MMFIGMLMETPLSQLDDSADPAHRTNSPDLLPSMPRRFTSASGPAHQIWWLHPASLMGCVVGVTATAAYFTPKEVYEDAWNTPKLFGDIHLFYIGLWIISFVFGSFLYNAFAHHAPVPRARGNRPIPSPGSNTTVLSRLFWFFVTLTLLGYLCWVGLAISRGLNLRLLMAVLKGEDGVVYSIRRVQFQTFPGVTTATQFGTAAVIFGMLLYRQRPSLRTASGIVCVLGLAAVRAIILSERLALLELLVPCVLLKLRLWTLSTRHISVARRRWLNVTPLVAVLLLASFFATAEYFRSWKVHYARVQDSFATFALGRLTGYYTTAFNNGVLSFDDTTLLPHVPRYLIDFVWTFPGMTDSYERLTGSDPLEAFSTGLSQYANPEFNNPGGMFLPAYDLGLVFVLVFWIIAGAIATRIYRLFQRGAGGGLLLYPLVFIGILELPRVFYLSGGRQFPSVFALLAISLLGFRYGGLHGKRPTSATCGLPARSVSASKIVKASSARTT